jgi:hydroxymethylbilane synthase
MIEEIIIATRKSALALWQAEFVAQKLRSAHAGLSVRLLPMSTRGDEILDKPLAQVGGKGLFLKELEQALQNNQAHLAVHSLKDVPMNLEPQFELAAILQRDDPYDAFVSNYFPSLESLPRGARVGTSSARRECQLRSLRPDLKILDVRGNVNTRLGKLDRGEFDAMILAAAGLSRLGLPDRIRARMQPPEFIPAAGQGALAVEIRSDDHAMRHLMAPLHHDITSKCVRAERSFSRVLGGSCEVPLAAFAKPMHGGVIELRGLIGDASNGQAMRASMRASALAPEQLGEQVANLLIEQGAKKFVQAA